MRLSGSTSIDLLALASYSTDSVGRCHSYTSACTAAIPCGSVLNLDSGSWQADGVLPLEVMLSLARGISSMQEDVANHCLLSRVFEAPTPSIIGDD